MYKMFKKDREQWVEVASFDNFSKARYYARHLGYVQVDNPNNYYNYYYKQDCWCKDQCILLEPLTEEQIEELENGSNYEEYVENYGVAICRECGELIGLNTDQDYIEVDGNYFCDQGCAESCGYFWCNYCESWQDGESHETHDGQIICDTCFENHFRECDSCHEIFHEDDMHWDDYGDYCYCDNCWEEEDSHQIIKSYHSSSRPDIEIQRTSEDSIQDATFGTEIECECVGCNCRDDVASAVDNIVNKCDDLFMFEDDGSLSDNGYETISQPFTMRWFKQNKELFEEMFKTMIDMGARSHDTNTCGFHVHFGRHFFGNKQNESIDRLVYLFEKYKTQLQVFSRRKSYNWCEFPRNRAYNNIEWSKLDEVKGLDKNAFKGHHSAINLENYETIEIRIFKGTLNFKTYYATLELVNNIMHYVRDKSDEEVEKGEFEDILDYLPTECLKQYCLDRNII